MLFFFYGIIYIVESDVVSGENIDLPKLKEKVKNEITIFDEDLALIYDMTPKQRINYFVCLLSFVFVFGIVSVLLFGRIRFLTNENYVTLNSIDVISYDNSKRIVDLSIVPSSDQDECEYVGANGTITKGEMTDKGCLVSVVIEEGKVVFTNEKDKESKSLDVDDYVIDLKEKDKYYLALNAEINLGTNRLVVGEPVINWISIDDTVQIIGNKLKAVKKGNATVKAMLNGKVVDEIKVVVTDVIVNMPKKFNEKKSYLPCERFNLEESVLLDEILEYRISEAGYQTRAGAVAAARFLTLEFPYRIAYYWETGRLNNTGKNYVDGEGRYYHKGLYLHESKIKDIEASLLGPKIWGCTMKCYEDDPPYFYPGRKYPNGLDCSGFVSWALYNAGFDVGDRGAGESPTPYQLTDLGDFKTVTHSLIKSGKIKPGDLFNYWGHISILVGEDDDNYYIAESLNTFGGVVIKTYSKKTVMKTFKYVVLMDELYKEDGNLTDLWY